jgi:nucleolar protein 56
MNPLSQEFMTDFEKRRTTLISMTKERIALAVHHDILIIQALNTIDDLTVQLNSLSKRLREWHAYSVPEVDRAIDDHETYCRLVAGKSRVELVNEFVSDQEMGAELDEADYIAVQSLARQITELYQFKQSLLHYMEARLQKLLPNVTALAGTTIAARLLAGAGSAKRLALLPASTIQLLGAEKALFRHLRSGAKSPKHGHIINHPFVQKAKREDKGKVARMLADKLALCARLDYFKGEFKADEYRKDLEVRFQ